MIKKFMIATTVVLGLFIVGGLLLSNAYEIRRSVAVHAPVAKVHALVGDLNAWPLWSPWLTSDASMQTEILQATGVGASKRWISEKGDGQLTFIESDAAHGIVYDMSFDHNRYANRAGFEYIENGEKTMLSWYIKGAIQTPIIGGYVAYLTKVMSVDRLESGLANIKKLAEKQE